MGLSQSATADLTTGLVAHYSFDDCTAQDDSGNGYDGIINGAPGCVAGISGKGLLFNGKNDYIAVNVPLVGKTDWTICSWINITKIAPAYTDAQAIITANDLTELFIQNDHASFKIYDFGIESATNSAKINQNTFLCFRRTGTDLEINKNTKKIASAKKTPSFTSLQLIGAWQPLASSPFDKEPFNGRIDDIRVYGRAIANTEIKTLYNMEQPITGSITGLQEYSATCTNTTTGLSKTIPLKDGLAHWSCKSAGLKSNEGDNIEIKLNGVSW